MSEGERMIRDINLYIKTQDVLFELLDEAKIDVYSIDNLANQMALPGGIEKITRRVTNANRLKNYVNALVLDSKEKYEQKTIAFSGLAEIQNQNRISIASALRMPMTKLFGLSASGFNTGESDLENYNSFVESEIRSQLKRPIKKLLEIGCQILFGYIPHFKVSFPSLRILTALEEEQVSRQKLDKLVILYEQGVITIKEFSEMARKEGIITIQTSSVDLIASGLTDHHKDGDVKQNHKYSKREGEPGNYTYYYPDGTSSGGGDVDISEDEASEGIVRKEELDNGAIRSYYYKDRKELEAIAKKTPLIEDKNIQIPKNKIIKTGNKFLKDLRDDLNNNPLLCPELNNKRVVLNRFSIDHLEKTKGTYRDIQDIESRVRLLPYIKDIILNGTKVERTNKDDGLFTYSLIGQAMVDGKKTAIIVALEEKGNSNLLYLSIFDKGEIKNSKNGNTYEKNPIAVQVFKPLSVHHFYLDNDTIINNESQVYKLYRKLL